MIQFFAACRTTSRSPTTTTSSSRAPTRGRCGSSPSTSSRCAGFKQQNIQDTVVFFGSARVHSRERRRAGPRPKLRKRRRAAALPAHLAALKRSRKAVEWSRYYEDARDARAQADRVEPVARGAAAPVRRLLGRRPRHHGGGQPRRARGRRQDHRAEHPAAVRAGRQPRTSPTGCTSSSTTSSCGSSGSPTWPRRW